MHAPARRAAAILTVLALLLGACSGPATEADATPGVPSATAPSATQPLSATPSAATLPADTSATPEPTREGVPFPYDGEFTLLGPDGETGETTSVARLLEDGRPLVLNLWAGACPPCRLEVPDVQATYERYGDRVTFFGLDVGSMTALGTVEDAVTLAEEQGVTYPLGTTTDWGLLSSLQVTGIPATLFITPSGQIVSGWIGLIDREQLGDLVEELLAASAAEAGA